MTVLTLFLSDTGITYSAPDLYMGNFAAIYSGSIKLVGYSGGPGAKVQLGDSATRILAQGTLVTISSTDETVIDADLGIHQKMLNNLAYYMTDETSTTTYMNARITSSGASNSGINLFQDLGIKIHGTGVVTGLNTPSADSDASTKSYTDSLKQTNRVFAPASPLTMNIYNLYPFVADKAAFVYIGYFPKSVTVKYVSMHNQTGGSGAQVAEVGLFSTPLAPNKGGQTLTCLAASGSIGDLTTTGMLRNSSSLNYAVPAGTHLWAGMRTDMATTQPECRSVGGDWGSGTTLYTNSAAVFSASNTYSGSVPTAAYFDADAPDLRVELD